MRHKKRRWSKINEVWDVTPCGLVTRIKTAWSWRQGHYSPAQYPRRHASLSASCTLRKEPLRMGERGGSSEQCEGDGALALLLPPRLCYYVITEWNSFCFVTPESEHEMCSSFFSTHLFPNQCSFLTHSAGNVGNAHRYV